MHWRIREIGIVTVEGAGEAEWSLFVIVLLSLRLLARSSLAQGFYCGCGVWAGIGLWAWGNRAPRTHEGARGEGLSRKQVWW